jgi:hypothetical protein
VSALGVFVHDDYHHVLLAFSRLLESSGEVLSHGVPSSRWRRKRLVGTV